MPTETNVYSRNLKVISILFIVYWFVGAHPKDHEIVLGTVRVVVEHPERLRYVAWALLGYFAWRFFINSKNKIKESYSHHLRNTILFKYEKFWNNKIMKSAENDFLNKGGFDEFKSANRGAFFEKLNPKDCRLNLPSFINSNTPSKLTYKYNVVIPREVSGVPKTVHGVERTFKFNLFWKSSMHIHIFSKWLISSEDSADFFIPWALFALAVLSILMTFNTPSPSLP